MLITGYGVWHTPIYEMMEGVFLKLESLNLGGSHKVRAARWMLKDALKKGLSTKHTIIEETGGNLGVGLSIECNRIGIDLELAVGNNVSAHEKRLLSNYGTKLIGTDMINNGMRPYDVIKHHLKNQDRLGKEYIYLDYFNNESNLQSHIEETGQEILDFIFRHHLQNKTIHIVGGIGTGASLSGIAIALKEKLDNVHVVGVTPKGCDIKKGIFVDHSLQGLAVGIKSKLLRLDMIDEYIDVPEEKAFEEKKWLLEKHGVSCGNSTGANIYAVKCHGNSITKKNNVIFSIVYDSGDSYIN